MFETSKKATRNLLAAGAIWMGMCGAASPAVADYLPEDTTRQEQVESVELVGAYLASDGFVLSRLELRKLSADVVADLVEVAQAKRFGTQARSRALQSLALYAQEDERASQTLDEAIERFKPGHPLCPTAIIAYSQARGEDSTSRLDALARHERAEVRMAAVVGLGRFGGQTGYEALMSLAQTEEHEQVRARILSYVQ